MRGVSEIISKTLHIFNFEFGLSSSEGHFWRTNCYISLWSLSPFNKYFVLSLEQCRQNPKNNFFRISFAVLGSFCLCQKVILEDPDKFTIYNFQNYSWDTLYNIKTLFHWDIISLNNAAIYRLSTKKLLKTSGRSTDKATMSRKKIKKLRNINFAFWWILYLLYHQQ